MCTERCVIQFRYRVPPVSLSTSHRAIREAQDSINISGLKNGSIITIRTDKGSTFVVMNICQDNDESLDQLGNKNITRRTITSEKISIYH